MENQIVNREKFFLPTTSSILFSNNDYDSKNEDEEEVEEENISKFVWPVFDSANTPKNSAVKTVIVTIIYQNNSLV